MSSDLERFGRHVGEQRKLEVEPFRWSTPWDPDDPVGSVQARMREANEILHRDWDKKMRAMLTTALYPN